MKKITFQYTFIASDFSEVFDLHLDAQKLELIFTPPKPCPAWANLEFHQCPNCPLSVQTHTYCPIAINMVSIVKRFQHILSFNEIHLKVVTDERTLSQDTTAQRAISSLMGFMIAASGCPHTSLLKPMVNNAVFYVIANFQDIKLASFDPGKIENFFDLKTYSFSATSNNAKDRIITMFKEMLNSSSIMI